MNTKREVHAISTLKDYIKLRDKYMYMFAIMEQEGLPRDVKNYMIQMIHEVLPSYEIFNKDIDRMMEYLKLNNITLTLDAYYMLNFIVFIFLRKTLYDAKLIAEHRRAHIVNYNDVDYALGIYSRNEVGLIEDMKVGGMDAVASHESSDIRNKRLRANTIFTPTTVEKAMNMIIDIFKGPPKGTRKVYYDYELKYNTKVPIYICGILDVFVESILEKANHLKINDTFITSDDIYDAIKYNDDLKLILLDIFL